MNFCAFYKTYKILYLIESWLLPLKFDADAARCIKLLSNNLTFPTSLNAVKVTGKRGYRFGGYGLAIFMTYSVLGSQKAIE